MTSKRSDVTRHRQRHNENAKTCCETNCPRRHLENPDFHRIRPRQNCPKVSDLVYKFLENVASANDERRQKNNARTNFQRVHVRKYSRQNRRPDDPKSNDEILIQTQLKIPKKSYLRSNFRNRSSVENKQICTNSDAVEIFEKKSSSQFVKDYIKAVNQSKRRAERYICKALSFGVDTGFLVPTAHSNAHVFRVSSSLDLKMIRENMDWRKEAEADDHDNRKTYFYRLGDRQDPESSESKSKSEKPWNKKNKLKRKVKRRNWGPSPAKKRRGKSRGRKESNKSREKSEDTDLREARISPSTEE